MGNEKTSRMLQTDEGNENGPAAATKEQTPLTNHTTQQYYWGEKGGEGANLQTEGLH